MAMIHCDQCGREISVKATNCPGCGAPVMIQALPPAPRSPDQTLVNPTNTLLEQVHEAIYDGKNIEAIRLYREAMGEGTGLAEAKVAVERLTEHLREKQPERFTTRPAKPWYNSLGCALIPGILLGYLVVKLVSCESTPDASRAAKPPQSPSTVEVYRAAKAEALQQIRILDWTGFKSGFGNVMEASFTITNGSAYEVKDLVIRVKVFGNSGTEIGNNPRTIYEVLKPGEVREFKKVNMGFINQQAAQTSADIDDCVVLRKAP